MQENCHSRRMSEEDLSRAKAQAQDDYVQWKSRLSTLEAEARRKAHLLEQVCVFLRSRKQERYATGELEEALSGKLIDLIEDLHHTRGRVQELHETLVGMGLPLKDD